MQKTLKNVKMNDNNNNNKNNNKKKKRQMTQEATFEKRDNAHPPGWLVGLEIQQKRSLKIGAFFADKSLGYPSG